MGKEENQKFKNYIYKISVKIIYEIRGGSIMLRIMPSFYFTYTAKLKCVINLRCLYVFLQKRAISFLILSKDLFLMRSLQGFDIL